MAGLDPHVREGQQPTWCRCTQTSGQGAGLHPASDTRSAPCHSRRAWTCASSSGCWPTGPVDDDALHEGGRPSGAWRGAPAALDSIEPGRRDYRAGFCPRGAGKPGGVSEDRGMINTRWRTPVSRVLSPVAFSQPARGVPANVSQRCQRVCNFGWFVQPVFLRDRLRLGLVMRCPRGAGMRGSSKASRYRRAGSSNFTRFGSNLSGLNRPPSHSRVLSYSS